MTRANIQLNGQTSPSKEARGAEKPLVPIDSHLFKGVRISLNVRFGETTMTVEELLALRTGSIVALEHRLNEGVDLYLNEELIAHGEIVAVDDRFGIRIAEIAEVKVS